MKNGSLREVIKAWYRGESEPYTTPNGSLYHEDGILYSYGDHFPLAIHIGGKVLVNGDRYSNSTAKHQSYLFNQLSQWERVEIPFSALDRALGKVNNRWGRGYVNIDPKDLEQNLRVVDQCGDTWIDTNRRDREGNIIKEHTLGGCVFTYNERTFFSGIDETGIGTHRYFLTELVDSVETVEQGLDSMKPEEVKEAERAGKEVLRQGEWFFVPQGDKFNELVKIDIKEGTLKIDKNTMLVREEGDTGHHFVSESITSDIGKQIVRGIVKHSERDHKQLKLYTDVKSKGWYIAYHNIQVQSFNAVGNVD